MKIVTLNSVTICVGDTKEEVVDFMLQKWREFAEQAISYHDVFNVALAGGGTPKPFYNALAKQSDLPWSKTHVFLDDERYVPLEHKDSNYSYIRDLPAAQIHNIDTTKSSCEKVAFDYEQKLHNYFAANVNANGFPSFDFMLLGIGEDGHVASLFPGHAALAEKENWVTITENENYAHQRITLTLPVIQAAQNLMFMVTGKNKANIVRRVFQDEDESLVATLVKKNALLVVDAEVAQDIFQKRN